MNISPLLADLARVLRTRGQAPDDNRDWPSAPADEHYRIEARAGLLTARLALDCSRCADGELSLTGADGRGYVGQCRCYRWRLGAARFTRACLPEGALGHSRASLDRGKVEWWEDVAAALSLAVQGTRGALLTGPTGVGKSHMAAAVIRAATLERGISARWARWPDVLAACRTAIHAHESPEAVLDALTRPRLLVLDELGGERSTEWTTDALTRVLSAAIDRGCTVVATSNHSAADLGRIIGERSSSRLAQLCPEVVVRASDYRRSGR